MIDEKINSSQLAYAISGRLLEAKGRDGRSKNITFTKDGRAKWNQQVVPSLINAVKFIQAEANYPYFDFLNPTQKNGISDSESYNSGVKAVGSEVQWSASNHEAVCSSMLVSLFCIEHFARTTRQESDKGIVTEPILERQLKEKFDGKDIDSYRMGVLASIVNLLSRE